MTAYTITFARIGQTTDPKPVTFTDVKDREHLVDLIVKHVRPFLASPAVFVSVDFDKMRGAILSGFRSGGTFKVEAAS